MNSRNLPVISDEKVREKAKLLFNLAEKIGGLELKNKVIDAFVEDLTDGGMRAYEILNDEQNAFYKLKSDQLPSNVKSINLADVDDEAFIRSICEPTLLPVEPFDHRQVQASDQRVIDDLKKPITFLKDVDDKALIRGLCEPSF